jgi:hypothetical protein
MTHPKFQGRSLKNDLRVNECSYSKWQEDCRKIYGSIKEESWRIRTNKEGEAILQEADIIKRYNVAEIKMVWTYWNNG